MKNVADFFGYARLRYETHVRRDVELLPGPWTTDPTLQMYRFCNIHREDDKVTTWFRDNIRGPLADSPNVLLATVAFRWFNRVEMGELMKRPEVGLMEGRYNGEALKRLALEAYPKGPWTTGSYMIKSPGGMTKIDGLNQCIDNVAKDSDRVAQVWLRERAAGRSIGLEEAWEFLRQYPYLGDFMAYEVVTDLRFTSLLDQAPDILTWANPGPGAARGLARVQGLPIDAYNRHSDADRAKLIAGMQELLEHSRDERHWPAAWPKWEMREVEHTLCEFDKYERSRLGEGRPKQLFRSNQKRK